METDESDVFVHRLKELSDDEKQRLEAQNSRLIPEAKAQRLEREAKRHWDIFYKRNETKFFRDRHWTTREFQELINFDPEQKIVFLELGCGVGNMLFPLVEEGFDNFYFYACDFSPRAVEFVKSNKLYDPSKMTAFCADLTTDELFENVPEASVDIASLIFVLSAIQPACWDRVVKNALRVLRPGGVLLFRDYGRYDMAQLRFKPGHKIAENFYMRQDGTRSYYFTEEELATLFTNADFEVLSNSYVQRRTVNFKEGVDVPRIFVQGKYKKKEGTDLEYGTRRVKEGGVADVGISSMSKHHEQHQEKSPCCAACRPRRDWSDFLDLLGRGNVGITIYRYTRPTYDDKTPRGKEPRETLVIYTTKNIAEPRDMALDIFTTRELPKCAKYCPRCKALMRQIEQRYQGTTAAEKEAGLSKLFSCPPCTDIVHKFRKFSRDKILDKQDSELIHLMRQTGAYDPHRTRMFDNAMGNRRDTSTYDGGVDRARMDRTMMDRSDAMRITDGVRSTTSLTGRTRYEDTKSTLLREGALTGKQHPNTERTTETDLTMATSKFFKKEVYKDKSKKSSGKTSRTRSKLDDDEEKENIDGKDHKRGMGRDSKHGIGKGSNTGIGKDSMRGDGKGSKTGIGKDGMRGDGKGSKADMGIDGKHSGGKGSKQHGANIEFDTGKHGKRVGGKDSKLGIGKNGKHGGGKGSKHDGTNIEFDTGKHGKRVGGKDSKLGIGKNGTPGGGNDSKNHFKKDSKHGTAKDDGNGKASTHGGKRNSKDGVEKSGKRGKDKRKGSSESVAELKTVLKEPSSKSKSDTSVGFTKSALKLGNKKGGGKKDKETLLFEKANSMRLKIEQHARKKMEADQKRLDKARKDIESKMASQSSAKDAALRARADAEEARQQKFKEALGKVAVEESDTSEGTTEECSAHSEPESIIVGEKIYKYHQHHLWREPPAGELLRLQSPMSHLRHPLAVHTQPQLHTVHSEPSPISTAKSTKSNIGGMFRYCLSERKYIHKGWTLLPKEMVMRKIVVYRMMPSIDEYCWFTLRRSEGTLHHDSGELMATFDDGSAKLYYRSGELAMEMYHAQDPHAAGHRVVVYSKSQEGKRGRSQTVLAVFDYSGNGCVFDHSGHTRLKYSQNEGIVLDRNIGPHTHWKWHNLNDSGHLHTVLIEHHLTYTDPIIAGLAANDIPPTELNPDDFYMKTIESQNIINEKRLLVKKFSPYQIKMKIFKLNDYFSLRIIEQSTVFLTFADGKTRLKMNVGMVLDPTGIVGEDFVQLGDVQINIEKTPASSESLERLQRVVHGARAAERAKLHRDERINPPVRRASVLSPQSSRSKGQRRYN